MKVALKSVAQQVIVITGASSGIGLVTARAAAARGASLVLAARSGEALDDLVREIVDAGGEAIAVTADVGDEDEVQYVAQRAVERFGRFDTWVNNAGVSVYGELLDVATEDHRRLFETNFWGVVYGSTAAARFLRGHGGAIVNVGSTLSDRAIPLQGMYCASKHAVKGFTDALRMELEAENAPVSVSLVKPGAIDTPYVRHAKNYLKSEPMNPPPVYAPEVVADAILYCAENPVRDIFAGGAGKAISAMGTYAPRLSDRFMSAAMIQMQHSDEPAKANRDRALYAASEDLAERGGYPGHVMESSLYTKSTMHPAVVTGAVMAGVGLALVGLARARSTKA